MWFKKSLKYTLPLLSFHLGFTNMSPHSLRFLGSVLPPTPTIVSEIALSFVYTAHILLSRFSLEWVPVHRSQSALSPSHLNGRPLDSPAVGWGKLLPVQLLFSSWNTKHPVKTWWLLWDSLVSWSTNYLLLLSAFFFTGNDPRSTLCW